MMTDEFKDNNFETTVIAIHLFILFESDLEGP